MRSRIIKIGLLVAVIVGVGFGISNSRSLILSPLGEEVKKEPPYLRYSFARLAERGGIPSEIVIVGSKFYYQSEGRRISGEINIPVGEARGVVIMARGYVDKEIYKTGIGTHNAAVYLAKNGYLTYAPDFSGYGESDPEDPNALGARLVKPMEILDLIASVAQDKPIYLWGHSNGGQIMISVAEIVGLQEPTLRGQSSQIKGVTLWAPVSKPFPYSILYYTDEADDQGKWLRGQVAEFEREYDVYDYSIDKYWEKIDLPIQIHQGSADEAVPKKWSDQLVESLKAKDKIVTYYVYPGADHNLRPGWDTVVARDSEFFHTLKEYSEIK